MLKYAQVRTWPTISYTASLLRSLNQTKGWITPKLLKKVKRYLQCIGDFMHTDDRKIIGYRFRFRS